LATPVALRSFLWGARMGSRKVLRQFGGDPSAERIVWNIVARLASTLLIVVGLLTAASSASGQSHPIFDAKGAQPNRDYFTAFPFEHIDTAGGGLTLTFTDLVSPGNAGRELRFQRSYNSKSDGRALGIAGLVMHVSDLGWTSDPVGTRPTAGTAGGGESQFLVPTQSTGNNVADSRVLMNDRFWKYDRQLRELRMPDGTLSKFDVNGR
jgi:hypothetical protein